MWWTFFFTAALAVVIDFGTDRAKLLDHVATHDQVLVYFYAPWCNYCKQFDPIFTTLELSHNEHLSFVKFNGGDDRPFASVYVDDQFPSVALWENGKFFAHAKLAHNSLQELINWVDQHTGDLLEYFEDEQSARDRANQFSTTFLCVVRGKEDLPIIQSVVKNLRHMGKFIAYKGGSEPTISVKHWGEKEHKAIFNSSTDIENFVNKYWLPLFGRVDASNQHLYFMTKREPVFIVGKLKDIRPYLTDIRQLATQYIDKLSFMWIDLDQTEPMVAQGLGVTKYPGALMITGGQLGAKYKKRYIFPSTTLTKDTLVPWIEDVLSGKVRPNVRSHDVSPPDRAFTPVKLEWVSADNFEEQVFHADSDFVLILTAPKGSAIKPGCTQCEVALSLADKLAQKLDTDALKFGEMMVTVNEIPLSDPKWVGNWTITELPVAYFIKAGERDNFTQWDAKTVMNPMTLLERWAQDTDNFKLEAQSAADRLSTELTLDKSPSDELEKSVKDEL